VLPTFPGRNGATNVVSHDTVIDLVLLATAALTAAFFAYIYTLKRQLYLLLWTAGWSLVALYWLSPVLAAWVTLAPWQDALNQWVLALGALLFFCSAQVYAQSSPWVRRLAAAAALFVVWVVSYQLGWVSVPLYLGVAIVFFGTAWLLWQESRKQETFAEILLAVAFLVWGATLLAAGFWSHRGSNPPLEIRMLALVPRLMAAVAMVMALYEEEKRRVERNMLALSNLNLATSSFVGGEIQKMLSQALDRVLSVVRIPAGALFLHHGDPEGPTSVVAAGLSDTFCAGSQEEGLDDHLVSLVARLGGLVVFRDLGRDAAWVALEREEAFRKFRQLALNQNLRTVVGISLQAKAQAFGVLLLGTPDNRRFTPAELRLLLALGHQIGMAVENSYLIQQTSRRSEELHILNEIGRALSSTLERDALFEKIFAEMRRLFDVSNFYIAFHEPARNEIRFELEVTDDQRLPKRVRPAGNHLTEHLIRTRQPLLIRENFTEEARKLDLQPLQQTGCFCGVPLVLNDRAIGVMAVHSVQERLFDEGHLELMRVLASEACIAIENARLFRREQNKSRHLTLLNNISRDAITTLNPDEMLAKIAEQLEGGLSYDHIGIGLLDYSTKEVEIQAEAGRRRGALRQRIALGEGIVGRVARSGKMAVARDVGAADAPGRPLLDDSASAIALPMVYADQLLGVLYIETSELCDFSDEELLLMSTLADLISGALHNALTFQKAQEQAITDGLTGVKTHRFFMEALSAEWKRSTRAGRSFCLVLMDLDRFKFVNDFYGHLEGDLVLQRVAHILEQNCRRSDVVSRYGGDEFVILMPETNIEQGRQLASKLRAWIASDPLLREKNITGSFGIASFPVHGSTPQELIQVADASMYLSKHQGGNTVSTADHFDPGEAKKWKRDVLEAYLGVTLKRLFTTGPDTFEEIYRRLEQFTESLISVQPDGAGPDGSTSTARAVGLASSNGGDGAVSGDGIATLPPGVLDTVTSLALAIDAKDPYTQGHSQKVSSYSVLVAEALRLSDAEIEEIRLAGILHDIGKVGIPESVLNKSGPLNPEEWETMKQHVQYGARLLESLRCLGRVQQMVRHHHEFYDGSGYPDRLAGKQIPLGARILAIADAYDTITSDRTYKKARTVEQAFAELERCSAAQFDPELVRLFVQTLRQLPHPIVDATSSQRAPANAS
jgi:diguanylate cyclase (GGDEF)-like protein/putative nucleotidyltransferase with HDIG domain